ncbi:MAG: M64 family metallopeptidase [bacterium]|nr:M64 family metallopeptidase [bacterium]
MKRLWIAAILAVAFLGVFVPSGAQTPIRWEVIKESSSKANYANLVILPDAFMAGDQLEKDFPAYAKAIVDTLAEQAKKGGWAENWARVRITLAKVVSEESGASYPYKGIVSKTSFGSFFADSTSRRIDFSEESLQKIAQTLNNIPGGYDPQKDTALLILNDPRYGGTHWRFGPSYNLATTSVIAGKSYDHYTYIGTHELGHNWLGDEYPESSSFYDQFDDDSFYRQDWLFNIMRVPVEKFSSFRREDINWYSQLTSGVKIPTERSPETSGKVVGFYKLRPTEKNERHYIGFVGCIMNGGWSWRPNFCPVCQEGIRRGLHRKFEVLAADFDEDGEVDLEDFFIFVDVFGKKVVPTDPRFKFDLDKDGEVSFGDFFIFADLFGKKKGLRKPVPVATKPVIMSTVNVCKAGSADEINSGSHKQHGTDEHGIQLNQNFPNPFNPETIIQYSLPEDTKVRLTVYNILGQEIIDLVDERQLAGMHNIRWDGRDRNDRKLASGIYYYQLTTGKFSVVRSLTILK